MSKRILFVDDEPEWRLIPGTALRDTGYEVITAKDVFETGLQTYGVKLDLIILDVNLGNENAPGLMRLLKEGHPGVPILLYSGLEQQDPAVQSMLKDGAHGYLRKGAMKDLIEGVAEAIDTYKK
jgi:DNA-binding NtrC family response regulator